MLLENFSIKVGTQHLNIRVTYKQSSVLMTKTDIYQELFTLITETALKKVAYLQLAEIFKFFVVLCFLLESHES